MVNRRFVPRALFACALAASFAAPAAKAQDLAPVHEFADGLRHFKSKDWDDAAIAFGKALKQRAEDGELVRVLGSWFEPYLPELYYGVSLYELGCYEEALRHLEASVATRANLRKAEDERELLEDFAARARELVGLGLTVLTTDVDCARWKVEAEAKPE